MWFFIPFLFFGFLTLAIGWSTLTEELAFGESGTTATAHVIDLRRVVGEDSTTYYVDYAFADPGGTERRGSSSVDRSDWAELRDGDPVTVTFLIADPARHRLGTPEPQLGGALALFGFGSIFAVVGVGLGVLAIRQRRAGSPAAQAAAATAALAALGPGAMPGPVLEIDQRDRRRVDVFTRSPFRVFGEVVVAPVGGAALLLLAAWSLTHLFEGEVYVALTLAGGFIGTLILAGGIDGLRRGASLRLLEVGPDGIWLPRLGRLAWADVAEVRLEVNTGPRRRRAQVRRVDVLPDGREVDQAARSPFRRLGVVPRDGSVASRTGGELTQSLYRGLSDLANSRRRDGIATEVPDLAPFGVGAYELRPSIEAAMASIRRFAPIVDRISVPAGDLGVTTAASPEMSTPAQPVPASQLDLRALDARLGASAAPSEHAPPGSLAAALLAARGSTAAGGSFVAAEPGTDGLEAVRAFRRRGFGIGHPVLLTVGPDGVRLRERPTLPWASVDRVTVEDEVLRIQAREDAAATIEIRLDQVAEDDDEVLDAIARYHLVDER